MPIDTLNQAIQSGAWSVVVGTLLVILVYLAKHQAAAAQWQRIPAAFRPLVPIAIGILSGVGDALVASRPWVPALIAGVVSSLPALLIALPSPVAHLDAFPPSEAPTKKDPLP